MNNNEEDDNEMEEDDDPLHDLYFGDLEDIDSDEDVEDIGTTNRPYRAKEKICFVPVDRYQTMNDVASNVVPADLPNTPSSSSSGQHSKNNTANKPIIQSTNSSTKTTIDRDKKNIRFTNMDDDGNDIDYNEYDSNEDDENMDDNKTSPQQHEKHEQQQQENENSSIPSKSGIVINGSTTSAEESNQNDDDIDDDMDDDMDDDDDDDDDEYKYDENNPYGNSGQIDLDDSGSSYSDSGSFSTSDEDEDDDKFDENYYRDNTLQNVIHTNHQSNYGGIGSSTAHIRIKSDKSNNNVKINNMIKTTTNTTITTISQSTLTNPHSMSKLESAGQLPFERNFLPKRISKYKPSTFDICLFVSSPLTIKQRIIRSNNYLNYNNNININKNKSTRISRPYKSSKLFSF